MCWWRKIAFWIPVLYSFFVELYYFCCMQLNKQLFLNGCCMKMELLSTDAAMKWPLTIILSPNSRCLRGQEIWEALWIRRVTLWDMFVHSNWFSCWEHETMCTFVDSGDQDEKNPIWKNNLFAESKLRYKNSIFKTLSLWPQNAIFWNMGKWVRHLDEIPHVLIGQRTWFYF